MLVYFPEYHFPTPFRLHIFLLINNISQAVESPSQARHIPKAFSTHN